MKIVCDNTTCKLVDRPNKLVSDLLWGECAYEHPGAEMIKHASGERNKKRYKHWDGFIRLYHRTRRVFGAGLLDRVRSQIESTGEEVEVTWAIPEAPRARIVWMGGPHLFPRPYQLEAVVKAMNERRCMVQVATGGGKTLIAAMLIFEGQRRTVFLVHTKDLLYQAKSMLAAVLGAQEGDFIGQIGDGIIEPGVITVCTIQTAARALGIGYESADEDDKWKDEETDAKDARVLDTLRRAGMVIMDECHRVGAPTAVGVLNSMEAADHRFGLSASPWRDDGADIQLEAAFGKVAVKITATELWQMGFLVRPVIRVLDVPPMYFESGTRYDQLYKEYVVENEIRNGIGVREACKMMKRGRMVLILVRHIKHGKQIEQMMGEAGYPVPFLSGSDSTLVRQEALDLMRRGQLRGLIATSIADEGLDIPPLSGLVLLGGGKSSTRALQRVGRVLRLDENKKDAEVVDFDDQVKWLHAHSGARVAMYKSEDGWILTDV